MKKRPKESEPRPMKCAVCKECYERKPGTGICAYGGPYLGYAKIRSKGD